MPPPAEMASPSAPGPASTVVSSAGAAPSSLATAGVGAAPSLAATRSDGHAANGGDTLALPPLEPGYTRLMGPPIEVAAGESKDWMQWVAGPIEEDYDVSDMKGAQTVIGHHAILYTTSDSNPIGTSRVWTERDQLTSQTVGGVGAEGAIPIPPGVVLRIKKGTYLAFDVHYLNPSDKPRMGETYMDVKLMPANPASQLASRVANSSLMIELPPHEQTKLDIMCPVDRDLKMVRFTNHMHEYGVSTFTQFTDPAGQVQMIKKDEAWSEDWALAPNYEFMPVETPLIVPAGSVLHTHCEWNNTTDNVIKFPNEMCAFSGLVLGAQDLTCLDGKALSAAASEPAGTASAPAATPAAAGAAGSAGPADSAMSGAGGACTSADQAVLDSEEFNVQFKNCGAMCFGAADTCSTACLMEDTSLTPSCASCNGAKITCSMMYCVADCTSDVGSPGCQGCIETNCGAAYQQCAGS